MTEDTPNPEPAPGPDQSPDAGQVSGTGHEAPVPEFLDPSSQQPQGDAPAPPVAPATWPPSNSDALPTPEEDAALREERAKRFGGATTADQADASGSDSRQAFPQAQSEFGAHPTPAGDFEPTTKLEQGPQPVNTGGMPVVTPIPASPHSQETVPGTNPFPPTSQAQPPAPPRPVDDFEGFEETGPVTRAAAHWWTILITLVFAPVAWYLFTDGGARIAYAFSQGQAPSVPVFIEFGLGLLALFVYLLAARWSSLGSIILGSLVLALGVAFLVVPTEANSILEQSSQHFGRLGQFGLNVLEHLSATLETGRMAVYGLTMILLGVVSHGARRQGRREERTKIALGE